MTEQDQDLLTLTDVSERTGISMPTLGKYKKEHGDRIPSVGEGRTQRYPEEALPVFKQIKQENLKKRGRPKKGSTKKKTTAQKKPSTRKKTAGGDTDRELLPLTEIAERTGISYPTLRRYAADHEDRIPSEGEGRKRRYPPEAIPVFEEIYGDGKPGPSKTKTTKPTRPKTTDAALARRVAELEESQKRLQGQVEALLKQLKKPVTVTLDR